MRTTALSKSTLTLVVFSMLAFLSASFPARAGDLFTGNYVVIPSGGSPVIVRDVICADPNCEQEITDRPVVISRSGDSVWAGAEAIIPVGMACIFTLDIYLGSNCIVGPVYNFSTDPVSQSGLVLLEFDPREAPFTGSVSARMRNSCDGSRTPCINAQIVD